MGDRANVKLIYDDVENDVPSAPLYVYTHWSGTEMPKTAKEVLDSPEFRSNVGDPPYAGRVFITRFMEAFGATMESKGYGVSPYESDNNHPILEVDLEDGNWRWEGSEEWQGLDTFNGEYPED